MDYQQALDYLFARLPMYQRVGGRAYNKDLGPTRQLCQALNNPQDRFKSVHIAGTNGKGTSAHTIAAILQSAGHKTGLYTSPHLKSFTERIRINGNPISESEVVNFVNHHKELLEEVKPSFFETTVVMAFDHFARHAVDIAIVEVGMGGTYDSTNVITPMLSLITRIGLDHQQYLGDTMIEIASEKAGIIKRGTPVVIGADQPELLPVYAGKAQDLEAPMTHAVDYKVLQTAAGYDISKSGVRLFEGLRVDILGYYYLDNLPGILETVYQLKKQGIDTTDEHIRDGLANTRSLTGLKGRWQTIGEDPLTICDVGHNMDGIRAIIDQLKTYTYNDLYIILGTVEDKDLTPILKLLPIEAYYYFCEANIPRAMPASELSERAADLNLRGEIIPGVNEAIAQARKVAGSDDLIFVGGSTFIVAEINNL